MNTKFQPVAYALLAVTLLISYLSSCTMRGEYEPQNFNDPTEKSFPNYSISDLSGIESNVVGFISEFNTRCENGKNEFPINDYDFTNCQTLKSDSIDVVAIPSRVKDGDYLVLLREEGYIKCLNKFSYEKISDPNIRVTCKDDQDDILFEGIYDSRINKITLTYVSEIMSNGMLRSAAGPKWGCGLSLGAVGGMWGTVVGMACPIAGFAVGMAYTAFAV